MSQLQAEKKWLPLPPVHSVLWSNPVPWVCERCWHASGLVNAGTHICMGTNSPWSLTLPLQPDTTQAKPLCPLSRVIQFLSPVYPRTGQCGVFYYAHSSQTQQCCSPHLPCLFSQWPATMLRTGLCLMAPTTSSSLSGQSDCRSLSSLVTLHLCLWMPPSDIPAI